MWSCGKIIVCYQFLLNYKFIQKSYINIKVTVCTYWQLLFRIDYSFSLYKNFNVPFSRPNCQTNLHQILHRPPHQLGEGS